MTKPPEPPIFKNYAETPDQKAGDLVRRLDAKDNEVGQVSEFRKFGNTDNYFAVVRYQSGNLSIAALEELILVKRSTWNIEQIEAEDQKKCQ